MSIAGAWLPVKTELGGQKFPDETLKTMKLKMTERDYEAIVGSNIDKGNLQIDPSAQPMTMDITGVEGPNKGKKFLAIYELDGDSLRICYDLEGKKRPSEFKTEPNAQQFLVTYRREKP